MTNVNNHGFTLIELIVTVSLIAILSSVVVPITQMSIQRTKEQELKLALKEIRNAIDAFKQAGDEGRIERKADSTGYPETLNVLVDGVVDKNDPKGNKIYFLRRIPRDPMTSDLLISSDKTWGIRSYRNEHSNFFYDGDIYDIFSLSTEVGLNGIKYKEW